MCGGRAGRNGVLYLSQMKCYVFIIIHFDAEQIEKILFIIHLIKAKMTVFRQYGLLRVASDPMSLFPFNWSARWALRASNPTINCNERDRWEICCTMCSAKLCQNEARWIQSIILKLCGTITSVDYISQLWYNCAPSTPQPLQIAIRRVPYSIWLQKYNIYW